MSNPNSILIPDATGNTQTVSTLDSVITGPSSLTIRILDGSDATLGAKTDAANTFTNTTAISAMSVFKQVSSSVQAAAASLAGTLTATISTISAGENHLGEIGGSSAVVTGNFTRPADTNGYALGDLISNSTTQGSVVPITLSAARVNNKTGIIRRGRLTKSGTSTATAIFRAHFYKNIPAVSNGDNGVFQTDGALHYIGSMDFDMTGVNARAFTDGVKCITTPNVGTEIIFDPSSGTTNIYAFLEARAGYTPISAEVFTLTIEVMRD